MKEKIWCEMPDGKLIRVKKKYIHKQTGILLYNLLLKDYKKKKV